MQVSNSILSSSRLVAVLLLLLVLPQVGQSAGWVRLGMLQGAHVRAVAVDPLIDSTLYLGCDRGIYKSVDYGRTWGKFTPIFTGVNVLAIDPNNRSLIYAQAGSGAFYKSIDAGVSWQLVNRATPYMLDMKASSIANRIYGGTPTGMVQSTDGGVTWTGIGLAGRTINSVVEQGGGRIYAGATMVGGVAGKQSPVYFTNPLAPSVNWNSGLCMEWHNITDPMTGKVTPTCFSPSIMELQIVYPAGPSAVLFAGGDSGLTGGPYVFKSADGGKTWRLSSPLPGFFLQSMVVDRSGTNIVAGVQNDGVYYSLNGGFTWAAPRGFQVWGFPPQAVSLGRGGTLQVVYAGTSANGFFRSFDRGATWTQSNHGLWHMPGLSSIAINTKRPSILYAGITSSARGQPDVIKSTDGGRTWNSTAGLLDAAKKNQMLQMVSAVVVDPVNPANVYAASLAKFAAVLKSTNGGVSWIDASAGIVDKWGGVASVLDLQIGSKGRKLFAMAQFGGVYRSMDGGASWTAMNSGIDPNLFDGGTIALVPNSPVVYFGTRRGIYKSINNGLSWTLSNTGLTSLNVRKVVVDPVKPNRVYAGTVSGLFRSVNGGRSWVKVGKGITYVESIAFDPKVAGSLYIASGVNIFHSSDAGNTFVWIRNALPAHSKASALMMDPVVKGKVYAGTGGSGIFTFTLKPKSAKIDFNGDGKSDILFHQASTGRNLSMFMNGRSALSLGAVQRLKKSWNIVGNGDYNGDGKADILFHQPTTGLNFMLLMNSRKVVSKGFVRRLKKSWNIVGNGDYNGDGKSDILFHQASTGLNYMLLMNGRTVVSKGFVRRLKKSWSIAGSGDYNGDGKADILYHQNATGKNFMMLMNGRTVISQGVVRQLRKSWKVVGNGDYDGDGTSDILFHQPTTGLNYMLLMNGRKVVSKGFVRRLKKSWSIAGSGDYNGDGKADILYHQNATGKNFIMLMNGRTVIRKGIVRSRGVSWRVVNTN